MMFLAPSEKEIIACQATTWRLHSRQQYHEASLSTGRRTGMNALTREVHYQLTLGSYNILTMKTWERFTNNSLLHVVNNDCKQDNIFMTDHNASYIMSSTSFKKGYQADNLLHTFQSIKMAITVWQINTIYSETWTQCFVTKRFFNYVSSYYIRSVIPSVMLTW